MKMVAHSITLPHFQSSPIPSLTHRFNIRELVFEKNLKFLYKFYAEWADSEVMLGMCLHQTQNTKTQLNKENYERYFYRT
jgi:hypothetical protein